MVREKQGVDNIMKSKESVAEIGLREILKESEDIVDDSYITTQDARRILDKGYKVLEKCKELRESRDKATEKKEESYEECRKLTKENKWLNRILSMDVKIFLRDGEGAQKRFNYIGRCIKNYRKEKK